MNDYSHLLHSPHNKRRSLQKTNLQKTNRRSKSGKSSPDKIRRSKSQGSDKKPLQRDLKDVDLKSHKYYTSPDEETLTKASPRYCNSSNVVRQAAVDEMIAEKRRSSSLEDRRRLREKREEADKYQALLKATEYERDRLKEILFEKSTCSGIDTSQVTRQGPVYKEFLSPKDVPSARTKARRELDMREEEENISPLPSPRDAINAINNLTSIISDGSEVENNAVPCGERKRGKRDVSCASTQSISPFRRDMSSSYKEEDFTSCRSVRDHKIKVEDKSINTSFQEPLKTSLSPRPGRRTPLISHGLDTFDTISDSLIEDLSRTGTDIGKKVSFIDDTDKDIVIKRLGGEVDNKERELKELRYSTTALKKQLSEAESNRIVLESEALRLSLQTITGPKGSPQKPPYAPTSPVKPNISTASAYNDITEVNSMLHMMKTENESLKAALRQATMETAMQTQLLDERLAAVTKERDNFAEENRRFHRLVAQDDKGSRIALLQRDLQTSITENDKLRIHLQKLRETYAKFFGGTI